MQFTGLARSELLAANMHSAAKQNMEYKFVELMSLQYTRSPEDIVQHQITYRYNAMKVSFKHNRRLEYHVSNTDQTK